MPHIVMSTDSLSLPRPWRHQNPAEFPEKFTKFEETYPVLLENFLRDYYPVDQVRVTNFATRASSLAASYGHRYELFSWMQADVAVLHKGVVDCWPRPQRGGLPNTSPEAFRNAMNRLLDERARMAPHLPFIVIGIAPTNSATREKDPQVAENIRTYNAILRERMDDHLHFLDMEALLGGEDDDIIHPDGHHLTARGHARLAQALCSTIVTALSASGIGRDAA